MNHSCRRFPTEAVPILCNLLRPDGVLPAREASTSAERGGVVTVRARARAGAPQPTAADDGDLSPVVTFDDFYHAHFRSVTTQLCAYVGDLGQAQDLTQEAFCRAYVVPGAGPAGGRRTADLHLPIPGQPVRAGRDRSGPRDGRPGRPLRRREPVLARPNAEEQLRRHPSRELIPTRTSPMTGRRGCAPVRRSTPDVDEMVLRCGA